MTREKEIYKVTLVGSVGNAALVTFKFIAGILGNSAAMIADAVHSLSDFATDLLVLIFVSISAKPQDSSHDYGHGKFETIATFLIGLALVGAATGIMVSGAHKLVAWWSGETLEAPGWIALWAALISIAVKELLYQYTARKARQIHSEVMMANAWHHRSDSLSSIGAAAGIGCAICLGNNWTVLDPVASIVVGMMLLAVAYKLLRQSTDELTDGSLPDETEREIMDIIQSFGDGEQPHGGQHREAASDIVGDDVHGVALVDGDVVQGAFAGVGDGHDALRGFGFPVLLFEVGFDDAESHGGLGGGARLGDDGHAVIFMVQEG